MKKIRFRKNGKWSKWYAFDKAEVKDDIEAMEVHETMTMQEIRIHFPEEYKKLKSKTGK